MENVRYILMPGMHGTPELYPPFTRALESAPPKSASLRHIDYPTDRPQSYQSLLTWLDETLDWKQPTILIAESFSGPLAIQLAELRKENIFGIVLAASFCHTPLPSFFSLFPLRVLLNFRPPNSILRHFLTGYNISSKELQELKNSLVKISPKVLSERIRTVLSLEESDIPQLANIPVLILNAKHDNLIPWSSQTQLEAHFPHSETHWLQAPHFILQNQPLQCTDQIVSWLQNQCHPSAES